MIEFLDEWKSIIAWHLIALPEDTKALDIVTRMSVRADSLNGIGTTNRYSTNSSYVVAESQRTIDRSVDRDSVHLIWQELFLEQRTLQDIPRDSPITIRESKVELTSYNKFAKIFS